MEIKLFVRTHKENFGSVLLFSNNMLPKEKRVMEDIKYTKYEPDESEIIELSSQGYYIYFCTYIGGQDEYGRDYQNVIGTLFSFRINEADVLNLRKSFKDVMKDISNKTFYEENRYFSEIRQKSAHKYHSKYQNRFLSLNFKNILVLLFLIAALSFAAFRFKNNILSIIFNSNTKTSTVLDNSTISRYNKMLKNIYKEQDPIVKYRLLKEFQVDLDNISLSIKDGAAAKKYSEIVAEKNKNLKNNASLSVLLDEYLNNPDFTYKIESVKKIKNDIKKNSELSFLKNIENKVDMFNESPDNDKLIEVINACKSTLPLLNSDEKNYVSSILTQADSLYKGVNTEVEIYISEKSAVFNRRTLAFEIGVDKQELQTKTKQMNSDPNIYAGSFMFKITPISKVSFKIYDHAYTGKKLLMKEMILPLKECNKPVLVSDGKDNSFKVEVRVIFDKFKIVKK